MLQAEPQASSSGRRKRPNDDDLSMCTPPKKANKASYTDNETHFARGSKGISHGYGFQVQLLMLFALSSTRFRLSSDDYDKKSLDDIVYEYRDDDRNLIRRYVQAKHRKSPEKDKFRISVANLKQKKGDFSMRKYFLSYLRLIDNATGDRNINDRYIICTNAVFKKGFQWIDYLEWAEETDDILNFGGKWFQFTKNSEERRKLVDELKICFEEPVNADDGKYLGFMKSRNLFNEFNEHINSFLDKLRLVINFPSEHDLTSKITQVMIKRYNDGCYGQFFCYIYTWWEHYKAGILKTQKSDDTKGVLGTAHVLRKKDVQIFFDKLRNDKVSSKFYSITVLNLMKVEGMGIRFETGLDTVEKVNNFVKDKSGLKQMMVISRAGFQTKIKVCQSLSFRKKHRRTIFFDYESFEQLNLSQCDPMQAFNSDEINLLIIDIDMLISDEIDKYLLNNFLIIAKERSKKIILMIHPDDAPFFQTKFIDGLEFIEDTNNKLSDLDADSKEYLLHKELFLFGREAAVTLQTLAGESENNLFELISGDALNTLISGYSEKLIIGREYEYNDLYVPISRSLEYMTYVLGSECLHDVKSEVFVIHVNDRAECKKFLPEGVKSVRFRKFKRNYERNDYIHDENSALIIILVACDDLEESNNFNFVCKVFEQRNVHLITFVENRLEWKQSRNSFSQILKYITECDDESKSVDYLPQTSIIAGEPGMGKTTLITTMANESASHWRIKIDMKHEERKIRRAKFDDLSEISAFFLRIIPCPEHMKPFVEQLLLFCMNEKGHVLVTLDSFDEIDYECQRKSIELVKKLKTTRCQVIISTRSYDFDQLEIDLALFANHLLPLKKKQQNQFLKQFWHERMNKRFKVEDIQQFVIKLRCHLKLFFKNGKIKDLVGIALQTKMIAEICLNDCEKYLEQKINTPEIEISDILDLYNKFIDSQYRRHFSKINVDDKLSACEKSVLSESYTIAHGNLALSLLFPHVDKLLENQNFTDDSLQKFGLMNSKHFIHKTYCEYFAAKHLFRALLNENGTDKFVSATNLVKMEIFKKRNKLIKIFLNRMIDKANSHRLKDEWKRMKDSVLICYNEGSHEHISISKRNPEILPVEIIYADAKDVETHLETLITGHSDEKPKGIIDVLDFFSARKNYPFIEIMRELFIKDKVIPSISKFLVIRHYLPSLSQEEQKDSMSNLWCVSSFSNERDLVENLDKNSAPNESNDYFQQLTDILIPAKIGGWSHLDHLNNFCCFLFLFYPDVMARLNHHINTSNPIKYTKIMEMIESPFLKGLIVMQRPPCYEFLQRFYTDLCCDSLHSDVESVDMIFRKNNYAWVMRNGILISKLLFILTPTIADLFVKFTEPREHTDRIDQLRRYYFSDFILNAMARLKEIGGDGRICLKHIDKLAILKLIPPVSMAYHSWFGSSSLLSYEEFKTSFKLINALLAEGANLEKIYAIANYLTFVGTHIEFALIFSDTSVILSEHDSDFQFEIGPFDMGLSLMKDWIKWRKNRSRYESQEDYYEKFIALSKGDLKCIKSISKYPASVMPRFIPFDIDRYVTLEAI